MIVIDEIRNNDRFPTERTHYVIQNDKNRFYLNRPFLLALTVFFAGPRFLVGSRHGCLMQGRINSRGTVDRAILKGR